MRIWDVSPGYLNRESLLGEHRELHGIVSIIVNGKDGYARHPETLRWTGFGWALKQRHRALVSEMSLRGYSHRSPVRSRSNEGRWPVSWVDQPGDQFRLLAKKYQAKQQGRIPLPANQQALWSQHKYSVLARDNTRYREIGRLVSRHEIGFDELALVLVELLRVPPDAGGVRNALQHMWGHVADRAHARDVESWSLRRLLYNTQRIALASDEPYLLGSTALSELMIWTGR
jgi:hypothetical protein